MRKTISYQFFSVTGTIGRHDPAAPVSSARFSLTGGFWALHVMPTPRAPALSIQLTPTNTVVVSRPAPSAGFTLQGNADPATTNWVAPTDSVTDNGAIKFIIVNPSAGNRFYRLRNP